MMRKIVCLSSALFLFCSCRSGVDSSEYEVYSAYIRRIEAAIEKAGDPIASCKPLAVRKTTTCDVFRPAAEWEGWIATALPGIEPATARDFLERNFKGERICEERELGTRFDTRLQVRLLDPAAVRELSKVWYRLSPSYDGPLVVFSRAGFNEPKTQSLLWVYVEYWSSAGGEYLLLGRKAGGWTETGRASAGTAAFLQGRHK